MWGTIVHEAHAAVVGLYVTFYYAGGKRASALPGRFWNRGGWPACVALIAAVQLSTIALAALLAAWGFGSAGRCPSAVIAD